MELSLYEAAVAFFGVVISIIIYFFQRRRRQIEILEKNFEYLQRINEMALSGSDNVVAAMRSIRRDEVFTIEEAKIYYFNYMRLNRLFRMWIYMQKRIVSKKDALELIRAGLPSVKEAEGDLHNLLIRAYPIEFIEFLNDELSHITAPPPIKMATT